MTALIDKLPWLAIALIIALASFAGYSQVSQFLKAQEKANRAPIQSTPIQRTAPAKPQYNVSNFKLFGDAAAPKPVKKQAKNLPKTNLRLTLRGISAGPDVDVNNALIETRPNNTELFRAGDKLPGNATVDAIYPDRVVLSRNGRQENLLFPEVSKGSGALFEAIEPDDERRYQDSAAEFARSQFSSADLDPADRYDEDEQDDYQREINGEQYQRYLDEDDGPATRVSPERQRSIKDRLDAIRARIRSER